MFEWITRTIADFGYMGLFALMWLENVFPPLPSELIIPLALCRCGRDGRRLAPPSHECVSPEDYLCSPS